MINLVERTMTQIILEYEDFAVKADVIIEPIVVGAEGEYWGIPTHEEIIGHIFYGEGIITYYDNDDNIVDEKETEIWGTVDNDGDFILDYDCIKKLKKGGE